MKTQKRDTSIRAFRKGYQAGIQSKSKETCPISHEPEKQQWLSGWREGRQDNWDGLTGVSGVSKTQQVMNQLDL